MEVNGSHRFTFGELIDRGILLIGDGYRAKLEELGGDGLIFLRAGHVSDSEINFDGVDRFLATLTPKLRGKMSRPGDIVVTTKGNSTGRVSFVGKDLPEFVYSPHLSFWRSLQPDRLIPEFLRYWSRSREFESQLQAFAYSTDMAPYLSLVDQKRLSITLPRPEEQRAIAHVLGTLDDKIELNRRMNETLEAMTEALFKSWFVDATQNGLPETWRTAQLAELCEIGRGSSPRPIHQFMGGDIPWIKIADSTAAAGPFIYETKEHVTKAGSERSYWVHPGDLILSNSATCGIPNFVDLHGCIHDGWLYFRDVRSISKHYLYQALKRISEHLVHLADGSVQKNLNTTLVGSQKIVVPDSNVIERFDSIVVPMFDRIRENGRESRTLAAMRDALLPKLLSGQLRVSES